MSDKDLIKKDLLEIESDSVKLTEKIRQFRFKFNDEPKEEEIKLEDVRKVLVNLSRNGLTKEVRELLKKYGADKLSEIDSKNYIALLDDAENLKNG